MRTTASVIVARTLKTLRGFIFRHQDKSEVLVYPPWWPTARKSSQLFAEPTVSQASPSLTTLCSFTSFRFFGMKMGFFTGERQRLNHSSLLPILPSHLTRENMSRGN